MRGIFISYRREDAEGQAGRLFDDLANEFGNAAVFMDVAGSEPGRDFRRAIDENVANCGVLLAIIGKNWLNIRDAEGQRRIDDPMDFVRLETAAALKRDIPVIPVLVQGANMPRTAHLPPDLVDIAFRNGVELTHARWDSDVQILFNALRPHVHPVSSSTREAGATTGQPKHSGHAETESGATRKRPHAITVGVAAGTLAVTALVFVGYEWHLTKLDIVRNAPMPASEATTVRKSAVEDLNLSVPRQAAVELTAKRAAPTPQANTFANAAVQRDREAEQQAAASLTATQRTPEGTATSVMVEQPVVPEQAAAVLGAEKRDREAKQLAAMALARKQAAAEFARKHAAELEKTLAAETLARHQAEQALARKEAAAAQVQKQVEELARMKDAEARVQTKTAEELARKEAADELTRENAAQEIKNKPAESAWPLPYSH